jgi:cellulose synthase/poly-beta-1,6-N-acetylglucosamine synthase-like glycosyltransferase/DNA-binding NarL/FixJ family response regulator
MCGKEGLLVTRVLLADDHVAVRDGLRAVLVDQRDIEVVGEAADGPATVAAARSLRPDLIILDNSMPGMSGLDVTRTLRDELPWTGIVFLTMDPGIRDLAIAAGATAFVTKDAPSDELIRAVRAAAQALVIRRQLNDMQPGWRRVLELLVGSRAANEAQIHAALAKRAQGESFVLTLLRHGVLGQNDLADVLARASETPLVSLAPYPELGPPIDPTESRLSSARLLDPVDRAASRLLPHDLARAIGVVVIASDGRHGVLAMADPLDDVGLAEAERHTRLRLTRVTAPLDEIQDALVRAFSPGSPSPVVWTGAARSLIATVAVMALVGTIAFGAFFFLVREALAWHFAFSLFALLCGLFFFLYALKYYVTIASVLLITLFGDPLKFVGRNGHANGNGHSTDPTNGNGLKADGHTKGNGHIVGQHREGYRTLRGENLSEAGAVVVTDPWQRIGEIRLPAERQPFVSIHLALYNESRVVDRLLTACTSFDYENYEVIVADDSTDETVELLKKWQNHPRVRVIHRASRKGFKGGALQEALRRMNSKTEYVMVFDADFVPPADAIWHFLDYFGRLSKTKNGNGHTANGNGHAVNGNGHGAPQNGDRLAVVQGYQWHMLNASENWITKGVRAEFSGSYVLERSGQELFGAMKMISGSVYMIRADVLRKLGWSTSITEDWELTIRLYLAGYKVLYTPYIQAPAECVSTVSRLIKQRMRWAEGHTYNVKKYFWPIVRSPNLTWQEKLEFVYYAPYYLQSVLFSVATVAWIVGVLILGQKLPMWGEIFGWSLVVSNALALPLMNLTGVLLEGSLRRDVFGLLSFIGLSWILVPFQAYASVKALFEKKEGGWVRTPKSGRVTEALERFHLARLMPWELPKRRRGQSKPSTGSGRFAAAAVVVLAAAGIITVGALSIRAAATSGITSETDLAIPALIGTAVPLVILALGWLRLRRRVTAVVLAFTLGLGTNVVFLANAVPVAAVTDNSSVFTFRNTSAFGSRDMVQNYTPSLGTPATVPTSLSANWSTAFTSDAFTTGQTMNAGTAQADLYLENQGTPTNDYSNGYTFVASAGSVSSIALTKMANLQSGDVIIAHINLRGGTNVGTITMPSASWNLVDRVNSGTSVTLAVYSLVAGPSEPASYTWSWSTGAVRAVGIMRNFSGVDTSAPVDGHAGATESSASTSHTAPSVNAAYGNEIRVVGIADASNGTCNTISGWNLTSGFSSGSGGGSSQVNGSMFYSTTAPPIGPTGTLTATCGNDIAATHQLTLKPTSTPTCTVTATVKKTTPIGLRSYTTTSMNSGTSLVMNTPAGTQQNDLMFVALSYNTVGGTITIPSGWTGAGTNGANQTQINGYRRIAGASEPASYTWTFSSATSVVAWEGSYIGVDPTTPLDTISAGSANGTAHSISSLTTTASSDLLIAGFSLAGIATFSTPTGMTAQGSATVSPTNPGSLAVFDAIQSAVGPSGTKASTSSVSGQSANLLWAFKAVASNTVTLGSATTNLGALGSPTLQSVSISTSGTTFATGDRLVFELSVPNDPGDCGVRLSYDEAATASKLTVATIVPEGVLGLLLLAPGLPLAARWWKRRRP